MEQVLFNIDLFTHITKFIQNIYCIYLNSICKISMKFLVAASAVYVIIKSFCPLK